MKTIGCHFPPSRKKPNVPKNFPFEHGQIYRINDQAFMIWSMMCSEYIFNLTRKRTLAELAFGA